MYVRNDVTQIRRNIADHVGSRIMLETNRGRQKSSFASGTIASTHPSIFTIQLDASQGPARTVSYSYTDVLTRNVEITVFAN